MKKTKIIAEMACSHNGNVSELKKLLMGQQKLTLISYNFKFGSLGI